MIKMETDKIMDDPPNNSGPQIHVTFLHSAKGNQQFNHSPMKIPPTDMCTFTKKVWPEYVPYYKNYIKNCLRVDECPVEPRVMQVKNHILNGKMFTQYAPTGLWKVYIIASKKDGADGFGIIWTMKFYDNGYFG